VQPPWDFALLVDAPRQDLLRELASAHTDLANLHEEIAFNKVAEVENRSLRAARIQLEGHRDALIEKKFLLLRLLDATVSR
jgi:hypothetical protein